MKISILSHANFLVKRIWNVKKLVSTTFFIFSAIVFPAVSVSYADTLLPPQNIGAEALCDPTVNIFWTAPNTNVQSYNIENIGVWAPKNTTSAGYADNAVSKDKYYIYDVTAVYGQGESEPASIFIQTPNDDICEDSEYAESENCPYISNIADNKYALEFNDGFWALDTTGSTIPVSMPAGIYKVSLVSFDGYPGRINSAYQPNEQWYVSLKNSSGVEIAKTSTNTDLRDHVIYDYKNEVVNESLTVNGCVASAQSLWGGGWSNKSGSLTGVCAYLEKLDGPGNSCQLNQNNMPVSVTSFATMPDVVNSGSSSILEWTATNAVSCMASGGWSGAKSVSGSESTGNLSNTTTYTLTCIGFDGSTDTKSVTVTVQPLSSSSSSSNSITSVNCESSVQVANIGQDVIWDVYVIPPSGSYTYSWSGDENLSGSSQSVTKSYSTVGIKNGRVDVGGAGNPQQCTATVRVMVNPRFDEF